MDPNDQFTLTPEAPPAGLTPLGVVIRTPEELGAEAARLVPYEKADRTPEGPLKELHAFAALHLSISPSLLISLAGRIVEHGSVVLFARNASESAEVNPAGYVIASYDARYGGFKIQLRSGSATAQEAFDKRVEALS